MGGYQRVTGFVVSHNFLFSITDLPAPSGWSGDNSVDGLLHVQHADAVPAFPGGQDGCFVHQVSQVGPTEPMSLPG
jgi:hypothetical protein